MHCVCIVISEMNATAEASAFVALVGRQRREVELVSTGWTDSFGVDSGEIHGHSRLPAISPLGLRKLAFQKCLDAIGLRLLGQRYKFRKAADRNDFADLAFCGFHPITSLQRHRRFHEWPEIPAGSKDK
jgi:hypothetical protein